MILDLPQAATSSASLVGEKARGLGRLAALGLTVPNGLVLTERFFAPWWEELKDEPASARRELARHLLLEDDMREQLDAALRAIAAPDTGRWAVRSSSPDEDSVGASFAGLYETVLGVAPADLGAAIAEVFASCFDERVESYKAERGIDAPPRNAVVLQHQLAAEVAGVAFSLDPHSNDYDRVVIEANHGLGVSVVDGSATPDTYVVTTPEGRVEARLGAKEHSVRLGPDGLVETEHEESGRCLNDEQARGLAEMVRTIEAEWGVPVDVEWAFASQGILHALQARPITTFFDLPDDLRTEPGARRHLYTDLTISVQGVLRPLSVAGTSTLGSVLGGASTAFLGRDVTTDADLTGPMARHGRLLFNVSNLLALMELGPVAELIERNMDPLLGAALRAVDEARYRDPVGLKRYRLRVALALPRKAWTLRRALAAPEARRAELERRIVSHREWMSSLEPSRDALALACERTVKLVFHQAIPHFVASRVALARIRSGFQNDEDALADVDALAAAPRGNVTVRMVDALEELGATLEPDWDEGRAKAELSTGALSERFTAWCSEHGHRASLEIDPCVARYRELPPHLITMLLGFRDAPESSRARRAQARKANEAAAERLLARVSGRARRALQARLDAVDILGGLRETPKYLLVLYVDLVRRAFLARADSLLAEGRLGARDDIFELRIEDLWDDALSLDEQRATNRDGIERLSATPELPRLFDSRGRILRGVAPVQHEPGVLAGRGVSRGSAEGPVRILTSAEDGPIDLGDVLVARATDPGWTPHFGRASALVLEVGGLLQHGALVAREYGLPCVAGIHGATKRLREGERVRVDGDAGTVRRLS